MNLSVRPVKPGDRDQWERLYSGYAQFYKVTQTGEMRDRTWMWLMSGENGISGLVAEDADGRLVGLAHFRPFARPLSATIGGFLDDLFVDSVARGSGAANLLLDAVRQEGLDRGWSVIRWITAEDNYRARSLYDRVGAKTRWVTYDITL